MTDEIGLYCLKSYREAFKPKAEHVLKACRNLGADFDKELICTLLTDHIDLFDLQLDEESKISREDDSANKFVFEHFFAVLKDNEKSGPVTQFLNAVTSRLLLTSLYKGTLVSQVTQLLGQDCISNLPRHLTETLVYSLLLPESQSPSLTQTKTLDTIFALQPANEASMTLI